MTTWITIIFRCLLFTRTLAILLSLVLAWPLLVSTVLHSFHQRPGQLQNVQWSFFFLKKIIQYNHYDIIITLNTHVSIIIFVIVTVLPILFFETNLTTKLTSRSAPSYGLSAITCA